MSDQDRKSIRQEIIAIQGEPQEFRPDAKAEVARIPDIARLITTQVVLLVYFLVICGAATVFIFKGFTTDDWPNAAEHLMELIKIAIIPVATLVLGYYFGSSSGQ